MAEVQPSDVVFVGHANGAVCWYRTGIPAIHLGCPWVGVYGDDPDDLGMMTGTSWKMPDLTRAKVVFLQLVKGLSWRETILDLRRRGVRVLYEIDDYIHGLPDDHEAAPEFDARRIADHEMCMEACDAIVTPTVWLADVYRDLAPTHVCRTGLDLRRYEVTRPEREGTNLGWAGSIGHGNAVHAWLPAVRSVMREREDVRFVTIGVPFADELKEEFPRRTLAIPFATTENYPGALCNFDIGLAPAEDTLFFRGKSTLRLLEYGACGIPSVASPTPPYDGHPAEGVTWAAGNDPSSWLRVLVANRALRESLGSRARKHVRRELSVERTAQDWIDVIESVTD